MIFSEKLDFLMNITKTANSTLARHTSLDASYISRLRNGYRKPAKKENYLKPMAEYFSRYCQEEYHRAALGDIIKGGTMLPADQKAISSIIYQWLAEDKADQGEEASSVGGFLEELSQFQFKKTPFPVINEHFDKDKFYRQTTQIYYGTEGKRSAVIDFLSLVIHEPVRQKLLLFSDEEISWLVEDPVFIAKWAMLLFQVIERGNTIKIIHTVSRNLDEMLAAIGQWLPIYMTGAIEPYYYPRKRDGIFKRTIFIAPETAAVSSSSVGDMTGNAANFLVTDKKSVGAMIEEFNNYFSLCRPLMKIYTPRDRQSYYSILAEFEAEEANSIMKTDALSIMSMPSVVAEKMSSRIDHAKKDNIISYYKMRVSSFEQNLINHKFVEIINIPDIEDIKNGAVRVYFADMIDAAELYYTAEEFSLHLKNIVSLLKRFENYHVCLSETAAEDGYFLYVKEELGVLVAKTSAPSVIFAINESNMTAAFWDFLNNILKSKQGCCTREETIAALEAVIGKIAADES